MLTEMVVDNYIPNDTHMTEEDARIQVCTLSAAAAGWAGLCKYALSAMSDLVSRLPSLSIVLRLAHACFFDCCRETRTHIHSSNTICMQHSGSRSLQVYAQWQIAGAGDSSSRLIMYINDFQFFASSGIG